MLIADNIFTDWANSLFHTILLWLDGVVYKFIAICYNLFIFLATEPIFDEEFFSDFAKRIYAILGVFMLFYLAYALLNALVDPEKLSKGDKSVSKIAMNLVISLILLGLSPSIFNYAYRLQNYILSSNLLGAVILGTDTDSADSVRTFGGELSFTVMNAFINPDNYNVNMSQDYYWEDRFKEDAMKKNNFAMLPGLASSIIKPTTDYKGGENEGETVQVQYYPGVSTLAGIFMIYVILSFTIDLGVRIFKFAFCQLLAPIPIVMRAMPGKKAQFDKWLKLTITVYLEVFVRVGFMYLAVYFVRAIVDNVKFDELFSGGRLLGMMALVILIMGVFAFAKQAPKMLGDILGIDSGNLKLGIGEKLKAGGFVGAAIGGFSGSLIGGATGAIGAAYGSLVNGAGLSGAAYGFTNGWKNRGMQFNTQRSRYYGDVMHGKGRAGLFGGQAYMDKHNDDNRTAADKRYTEKIKQNAEKFRQSDTYQSYAKNIISSAQAEYDTLQSNLDSKNKYREDYLKSAEYQGLMSRFENESIKEANQRVIDNLKNGNYDGMSEQDKRKQMADDQKTYTQALQNAKVVNELKRLKSMGASSAEASKYLDNLNSLQSDINAVKAAKENLDLLQKDRNTAGSAYAQAEEYFTDSNNKNLSKDIEQFQKDLEYVEQRETEAAVRKTKKTKEFQVQAAAYEAAMKNMNNPNSSKGTGPKTGGK